MTNFNVPGRGEVSASNQTIFDNLKNALGLVPNLYAAMAHSETALGNYLSFQNAKTTFSNKEKQAANLVVSHVNECLYCQSAHTLLGTMNGLTEEQTSQLLDNGSERAIRNVKVKQKVSAQFKSFSGAETFAIPRSVIDTAIKNNLNPLQSLSNKCHPYGKG